jgi:hypothetical protein
MLLVLLVDLFFVGSAVYLFLTDRTAAAVAMLVMGTVGAGFLVLRWANAKRRSS